VGKTRKRRVRLVHWNEAESRERAGALRAAGYVVDRSPVDREALKALAARPPDAIVIDLTRAPSQGRDLGLFLRKQKSTRGIPLVFAGGEPDKVTRVKELLPDAAFTTWAGVGARLRKAVTAKPTAPVVPNSTFDAYAGTPLLKKLGVKEGTVVALVGAPDGFEKALGTLPDDAVVRRGARGRPDLAIWFVRSRKELEGRVERMKAFGWRHALWIVWPKKASGIASDVSQKVVRETGLGAGIVDYKVCSVDETWSGLKFARRKANSRVTRLKSG
jgi:hypothetical protein